MAPKSKKAGVSKTKKSKSNTKKVKAKAPPTPTQETSQPHENPWRSVFDVRWISFGSNDEKKETAIEHQIPNVVHQSGLFCHMHVKKKVYNVVI